MKKQIEKTPIFVLLILFLLIICLTSLFVPTHDDYSIPLGNDLSGSIGNMTLLGNGRFLGNFFGNLLSLRHVPNTIIKSISFFAIIVCVSYLTDNLSLQSLIMSALLFLFPSFGIFSEAYVWSMGFYNYTISISVFLLLLSLLFYIHNNDVTSHKILLLALCGIFSFSQMLYSENEAIIFWLVIVGIFIQYLRKRNNAKVTIKLFIIVSLLMSTAGLITILSAPKFLENAFLTESYRSFLLPTAPYGYYLLTMLGQYCSIQSEIIEMFLFWGVLIGLLTYRCYKTEQLKKYWWIIFVSVIDYVLTILLKDHIIPIAKWNVVNLLVAITSTAFEIIVLLLCRCLYGKEVRLANMAVIFAVLSCGELIIVSPIGSRCFIITYLLLTIFLVVLYKETADRNMVAIYQLLLPYAIIYVALFANLLSVHRIDEAREEYIIEQMEEGKKEVEVISLPESKLLKMPESIYGYIYCYYYFSPADIEFVTISYDEYLKNNKG